MPGNAHNSSTTEGLWQKPAPSPRLRWFPPTLPLSAPGMHRKGGAPPPPLQGAQPMPSHCVPDGKRQLS